jgi:hypothetical protein
MGHNAHWRVRTKVYNGKVIYFFDVTIKSPPLTFTMKVEVDCALSGPGEWGGRATVHVSHERRSARPKLRDMCRYSYAPHPDVGAGSKATERPKSLMFYYSHEFNESAGFFARHIATVMALKLTLERDRNGVLCHRRLFSKAKIEISGKHDSIRKQPLPPPPIVHCPKRAVGRRTAMQFRHQGHEAKSITWQPPC